jgi:hypothetical protein
VTSTPWSPGWNGMARTCVGGKGQHHSPEPIDEVSVAVTVGLWGRAPAKSGDPVG